MSSTTHPADLAECVVPLDEEGAREVRLYWDRVIGEVWAPAPGVVARAVSVSEVVDACVGCTAAVLHDRWERREARRAMARVAAAGRLAPVVSLPLSGVAASGSGVAA